MHSEHRKSQHRFIKTHPLACKTIKSTKEISTRGVHCKRSTPQRGNEARCANVGKTIGLMLNASFPTLKRAFAELAGTLLDMTQLPVTLDKKTCAPAEWKPPSEKRFLNLNGSKPIKLNRQITSAYQEKWERMWWGEVTLGRANVHVDWKQQLSRVRWS